MLPFKKILYPTDFSQPAEVALRAASGSPAGLFL
jgi:hypothetical protein